MFDKAYLHVHGWTVIVWRLHHTHPATHVCVGSVKDISTVDLHVLLHWYPTVSCRRDREADVGLRGMIAAHVWRSPADKWNKKHLKNVGPIRHCEPPHCHSRGVATVARRLRYSHCWLSMSTTTTTTTTTTRDRGDHYGPIEWAQSCVCDRHYFKPYVEPLNHICWRLILPV